MLHISTSGDITHTGLHDYLIANIASFRRTFVDGNGDERMSEDNGRVHIQNGIITVFYANDIDSELISSFISLYKELQEVK